VKTQETAGHTIQGCWHGLMTRDYSKSTFK